MNHNVQTPENVPPVNKVKLAIVGGVVLAVMVALLFYNKSMRAAETPQNSMLRQVPVSVATAMDRRISEEISLVGTLYAHNDVSVVSETSGRITAVRADVGDMVHAGDVLVQVDDEIKQATLSTAQVAFEKSKKDWDRYQALFEKKSITASQCDQARLAYKSAEAQFIIARRQLNDTRIKSPISGYVTARPVDIGTMVQAGMPVANVVDISSLKLRLNVAEHDAFKLKTGDKVSITTEVYPGVEFVGSITSISAKGDDAHTYPVEIVLKNSSAYPLKAGMFGRVEFTTLARESAVAIPRQSLLGSIKNPQVFVVHDGRAFLRDIVVGEASGDTLGVRQGLKQGDVVVVNGQNNLRDSSAVAIVQ
ncbi:MAG: efflux RND transporter periplasmic adaptor subunit [Bacteroidota bacterium]